MSRALVIFLTIIGYVACQKILPIEPIKPFPVMRRCCPNAGKVMTIDLQSGILEKNYTLPGVSGVTIQRNSNPTYASRRECSHMADLKVTFQRLPKCWDDFNQCVNKPVCGNRMLKIELEIAPLRGGFLYNIGDSATNNGWGGDSNTQVNDAEIMGLGSNTYIFSSDKCPRERETLVNILAGAKFVTLYVSNSFTRVQTRSSSGAVLADKQFCNECLFALNMQDDGCRLGPGSSPPSACRNMDIYVALNNVILGTNRPGFGVCNAKLSWECCQS